MVQEKTEDIGNCDGVKKMAINWLTLENRAPVILYIWIFLQPMVHCITLFQVDLWEFWDTPCIKIIQDVSKLNQKNKTTVILRPKKKQENVLYTWVCKYYPSELHNWRVQRETIGFCSGTFTLNWYF